MCYVSPPLPGGMTRDRGAKDINSLDLALLERAKHSELPKRFGYLMGCAPVGCLAWPSYRMR
jgi:hypothetical protein